MQRNDVTIAIPLFNEERFIEAVIRTAAPQCQILLVSDNASTDRSVEICRALTSEFPNLSIIQQSSNLGASENFKFLLEKATTSKFMWLGAHDLLPDGYVSALDRALSSNLDAALAYGAAQHIDIIGNPRSLFSYPYGHLLTDGSPQKRLLALIRYLSDCSLVHGLFRREILRLAWVSDKFLGVDQVLLGKASLLGKFVYVPGTHLLRRDAHADDTKEKQLTRITGRPAHHGADLRELARRQYALACMAQDNGLAAVWYRMKARVLLIYRFGPFSKSPIVYVSEYVVWIISCIPQAISYFRNKIAL